MAGPRKPPRPGESMNVTRIEYENIEHAVIDNARRLEKLDGRVDGLSRQIEDLARLIRSLKSST